MPQHQLKQVLGRTLKALSRWGKAAHLPSSAQPGAGPVLCLHCCMLSLGYPSFSLGCRLSGEALPPSLTSRNLSLPVITFAADARVFASWEGGGKVLVCPACASQFCFRPREKQHRAACKCLLRRRKTGAVLDSSAGFHKACGDGGRS